MFSSGEIRLAVLQCERQRISREPAGSMFEHLTEQTWPSRKKRQAERRYMGLFGWFSRKRADGATRAWREEWTAAVAALDAAAMPRLEAALRRQPPLADDLEIEEEMLDGLRQLLALHADLSAGHPPLIDTTHRVVGADRCHFSAPVSLPDDPSQPTGRLLLTSTRAVFAGGAHSPALPWHGVREIVQAGRDVLFVTNRAGAPDGQRFRCNSYGEALCGAALARYLARQFASRQL